LFLSTLGPGLFLAGDSAQSKNFYNWASQNSAFYCPKSWPSVQSGGSGERGGAFKELVGGCLTFDYG